MAEITVLDQNTINKIAAGEVVERPASVVKELLENAIDAMATAVTVEIRDGGTTFIRVTDNGCGIPREQVQVAFLRHSTSKIKSVEDLFTVSSLGFRGEALASIASVSQVEMITKTSQSLTGTRYQIEGGAEKCLEEVGAPDGTTFIVRNLFYNTPARQKFLKTPQTEGAHVADLVERIAMSHPDISIRLIQNSQNKLHTSGNHNLKDMIYTVFGREVAANLLPVDAAFDVMTVIGFIGKPVIARSNRNYENYYINGRYIRSSVVSRAIEEAYKPFMMQHKYPFTLLHLSIEPELLDVNVHPAKMELRFRESEAVYRAVFRAVSEALAHKELIPQVELNVGKSGKHEGEKMPGRELIPEPFERKRLEAMHMAAPQISYGQTAPAPVTVMRDAPAAKQTSVYGQRTESAGAGSVTQSAAQTGAGNAAQRPMQTDPGNTEQNAPAAAQEQMTLFSEKLLEPKSREKHRLIGQLFDTYWLVEFNRQLFIIDQHAAHEKVLYEKTMKSLTTREYTSQAVNPPIILTLNMNEELVLKQYLCYFTEIGFEIEHFGGREYAVRGIPGNLFSIAKKELLMEMIDQLSEDTVSHSADMIREKVASMSCKAAVKGNHRLSPMEADQLIDQLLDLENPYACPHGRPTIISMSQYELEKKFKRIV